MNRFQTFQQFLATQNIQISMWNFILNLFLAAVLSLLLRYIYIKYGTSLSNRRLFSNNFMLITMTTMLVISIVKSSLALSLGLVGALSIVRFRAAIKEPEELAYLFLAIGIGLGFGAGQRLITITAFIIIAAIIIMNGYLHKKSENQNLFLTVASHNPQKIKLDQIVEILKKNCSAVNLKRFDETKEMLEASFLIEFDDFNNLMKTKSELQKLSEFVKITFLDNKGII